MDLKSIDPRDRARSLLGEFKAFAFKGSVIDLAVAVIIGAAFGGLVKSLVDNIIMPLIGALTPGPHGYLGWAVTVRGKVVTVGKFLGDVVNFTIVALALFLFVVKFLGEIMTYKKEAAAAAPPPTREQELLAEIRDLLKEQVRTHDENSGGSDDPIRRRRG